MATSYSSLKTEIADFYERNDLTSYLDTFIDLCEAEMQRELKLLSFETTATLSVTAGAASLPAGFSFARSLYWSDQPNRPLRYVAPDELNRLNASDPTFVNFYTVTGSELKFADDATGSVVMTYMATFTPLSDGSSTNYILASHPAAYLYGALKHAAVYCKDFEGATAYDALFKREMKEIKADNSDKKYAGPLVVRTA